MRMPTPLLRRLALPLAAVAVLASACGGVPESTDTGAASEDAGTAGTPTTGDPEVAASVNSDEISVATFEEELQAAQANPQVAQQLESDQTGGAEQQLQSQVLSQLIITQLLEQGAAEEGVEVGQAEIDEARQQTIEQAGGQEQFDQIIEQAGLSDEQVEEELRLIALQSGLTDALSGDAGVTDEQVQQFYEENRETRFGPSVTVRHILVEDEATAQEAKARIEGGEDFAAVAQELSTDTGSAQNGGDLGPVARGETVPEFEEAAYGAEVGELVGPVQTQFGYHLIEVTERNEEGVSLEEAEPEIRAELEQQQGSAVGAFLQERAAAADVTVNPRFGRWDAQQGTVVPTDPIGEVQPPSEGATAPPVGGAGETAPQQAPSEASS